MTRECHRLMMFDRPLAPWRDTRAKAMKDAVRLGHAEYDSRYQAHFLIVPAWIDVRNVS
jgi:hypothetical protein